MENVAYMKIQDKLWIHIIRHIIRYIIRYYIAHTITCDRDRNTIDYHYGTN